MGKTSRRINKFNIPDQDHTEHMNVKTILKDIALIQEYGFVFNGRFKTDHMKSRKNLKYYVVHKCGCASYRTMSSVKKSKTEVCENCTYNLNKRQISDNVRNRHVKQKDFYESMLIEGAKILEVLHKQDSEDRWYYTLKIRCACNGITEIRPADLRRHYRPKSKKSKKVACRSCGTFIGLNYGDYAPVKTMIKRLEKEIENVGTRN